MKRIFAIMAAVTLCFVLTVPTFAVESDYPPFPDESYNYAFVMVDGGGNYVLRFVTGDEEPSISFDALHLKNVVQYVYYPTKPTEGWRSRSVRDSVLLSLEADFVYVSRDVYDTKGNLVLSATPEYSADSNPAPVLGTMAGAYETSDFVLGTLGQVLSLVALVIPVVACMFGIRKGIAFLISRIRGV